MRWLEALWAVLLPPRCAACRRGLPGATRTGLCVACTASLARNDAARCGRCDEAGPNPCRRCAAEPPAFSGLRAPFRYEGVMASLVQAAKFSRREDVAELLGELLAEVAPGLRGAAAIVPVPLGKRRRRQRGFNQSAVLARALSRHSGVPLVHGLVRCRETLPQSDLGLAERRDNVREAFEAAVPLSGEVILVDDVVTSGHTAEAAARALLAGGAISVRVVALARASV